MLRSVSGYLFRLVYGRNELMRSLSTRSLCEGLKNRCLSPVSVAPSARVFFVSFVSSSLQSIYRVDARLSSASRRRVYL
jgi:hypothetical protein